MSYKKLQRFWVIYRKCLCICEYIEDLQKVIPDPNREEVRAV